MSRAPELRSGFENRAPELRSGFENRNKATIRLPGTEFRGTWTNFLAHATWTNRPAPTRALVLPLRDEHVAEIRAIGDNSIRTELEKFPLKIFVVPTFALQAVDPAVYMHDDRYAFQPVSRQKRIATQRRRGSIPRRRFKIRPASMSACRAVVVYARERMPAGQYEYVIRYTLPVCAVVCRSLGKPAALYS